MVKRKSLHESSSCYELIDILGLHILRKVLATMRMVTGPTWYSIIAEASDVQLNLSTHEDSVDYPIPNLRHYTESLKIFSLM